MDEFEDFEINLEDLLQIEELEINLLNNSFHVSSEEEDLNIQPVTRKRRRIMVIDSEESDAGVVSYQYT